MHLAGGIPRGDRLDWDLMRVVLATTPLAYCICFQFAFASLTGLKGVAQRRIVHSEQSITIHGVRTYKRNSDSESSNPTSCRLNKLSTFGVLCSETPISPQQFHLTSVVTQFIVTHQMKVRHLSSAESFYPWHSTNFNLTFNRIWSKTEGHYIPKVQGKYQTFDQKHNCQEIFKGLIPSWLSPWEHHWFMQQNF